jgi:two-component sensor histidine kinase
MQAGDRVVVEDVTQSKIFTGQPALKVLLDEGVRAVQSTPLMSSTGNILGMISTHFDIPHRPYERDLRLVDLLARQAADYLERKRAEQTEKTLMLELQHRSNNLLAVIQAIAHRSMSGSRSLTQARKAFEGRLQALARTNRRFTELNFRGMNLGEIVRLELDPFAPRAIVEGTNVALGPQQAQSFTLVLHELVTNAVKYGALSSPSGKLGISWTTTGNDGEQILTFKWQERGGAPVVTPQRHGFGTSLLKATFPEVHLEYAPEGFSCEIEVPIKSVETIPSGFLISSDQRISESE